MQIKIKTDADFDRHVEYLRHKYGESFEYLNGFHESQLNFSDFINGFIDSNNVANSTIDANANASSKDVRSMLSEKDKPLNKLFGYSKLFYELKKKYGLDTAKQWLEDEWSGAFYMHDAPSTTFLPYCYAYDLTRLANEGLFFLNDYNNEAPKHLTTFVDDVVEFISYFSNRSSGAVGIPNVLIWTYYFWKHDVETGYILKDSNYYLKQTFQKLIYRLNQPFLRVDQSSFTNVSIFDRFYVEELFGGVTYPDGTYVIDQIDEIIEHQKIFMKVVSEIRSTSMFTFPVLTYSLLYKPGEGFMDNEFARWCSDHNTTWNDSNFFISESAGTLSNCCFSKDQMVLTRSSNGVNYMTFEDLYNSDCRKFKKNFTVFHNGSWVKGKIIKLPARKMYKITTANNKEIVVTDNHLNETLDGAKKTSKLKINDYLLFNTKPLSKIKERDEHLTYEEGFLIGMYLGDGSRHKSVIELSLNKEKYDNSIDILEKCMSQLCDDEYNIKLGKEYNNVYPLKITSKEAVDFISRFVTGNYCNEKELSLECLEQSKKFRRGILDGYYLTDGGNSNRIYTTSEKLCANIEVLLTSLGLQSVINVSDRTDEPVIIRDEECKRNFPLYCIRWYDTSLRRKLKNVYKIKNNSIYFKIKSIKSYDYDSDYVYCFEMSNSDEPYFTLPNGIITHNCRLLSDTSKLTAFINSIGGTALSIGSVKVNTINLMRIAYETNDVDKYIEHLTDRVELCCKILDTQRHIIKRNIEKGLLPNYTDGGVDMEKQYSTVGILGLYEVAKYFGYIDFDEFGNASWSDNGIEFATRIFDTINNVKDNFTSEYSFNVESVPAERAACILCQKDNALYNRDNDEFIYSNQWIPLTQKCTINEKLRTCKILDAKCSGGAISHINLEANFPNTDMAWDMLNKIAESGVIYSAFNTRINECKNNHGFVGTDICPTCGEPVRDTYQRIVGYLVPTRSYSHNRFKEFSAREWYNHSLLLKD